MSEDALQSAVPDGEGLRYAGDLRSGGRVGLTDERLLVVRGEAISIELSDVQSVEMQDFDWFIGLMSFLLVGIGLYGVTRNLVFGLLFVTAGAGSMYLSYRKRSKATVKVHSRPKPLEFYPADGSEFYGAFGGVLDDYRDRHDLEPAEV